MPSELIYTSVSRGLRGPGATGFCTVAQTDGLPPALAEQLEALSVYRHLTIGADPERSDNPVVYSFATVVADRSTYHVLSRIADTGLDHTDRSNYLAHHVAFALDELPVQGPAWVCRHWPFKTDWRGLPGLLTAARSVPGGHAPAQKCVGWESATGDAGWGGVLAAATNPVEPAYLVYRPGQDVLLMFVESMSLISPEERWNVTFNTFYTKAVAGRSCQWRGVHAGTAEARAVLTAARGVVLRLDEPPAGIPAGSLVAAARIGANVPAASGAVPRTVRRKARMAQREFEREAVPPSFFEVPVPCAEEPGSAETRLRVEQPPPPNPGTRPLLLGLVLGLLLAAVGSTLIEVALGSSVLRTIGVKGHHEESLAHRVKEHETDAQITAERTRKLEADAQSANRQHAELLRLAEADQKAVRDARTRAEDARVRAEEEVEKLRSQLTHARLTYLSRVPSELVLRAIQQLKEVQNKAAVGMPSASVAVPFEPGKTKVVLRVTPDPKAVLDLFGLPSEFAEVTRSDGAASNKFAVRCKGTKDAVATMELKDGEITLTGDRLERYPWLALAVLRMSSGDGRVPVFYQLFQPVVRAPGKATPKIDGARYEFELGRSAGAKDPPVLKDVLETIPLAPGAFARVRLAGAEYDLRPMPDRPGELEYRGRTDVGPEIHLTVEKGTVVIEVRGVGANPTKAPECAITSLNVGRKLKLPDGSEVWQEVFRVH